MQQFAGKASPEVWVISISDNQAKHLFLSLNPACIQPLTLLGLERLLDHCHLKTHFIECFVALHRTYLMLQLPQMNMLGGRC